MGKVILLDNGHSLFTCGKRSPKFEDGYVLREYEFNRDIVRRISEYLYEHNIPFKIITPELDEDIALTTRANRVNEYCKTYGKDNCLFISVHVNACGNGNTWMNARGWSIWTSVGKTKSDDYATIFYNEANLLLPKYNMTVRKDMSDGDPDYEDNFTVLKKTNCAAVLTENLFQDNKIDAEFLRSEVGREVITKIHTNAIEKIGNDIRVAPKL